MLSSARNWIVGAPAEAFRYWYTYIPVSAAIVLFSTGWNLVGDGLRDAMDPRLRGGKAAPASRKSRAMRSIPMVKPAPYTTSPALIQAPSLEDTAPARLTYPAGTPLDDPAAFAWLEYLAVRQGAVEALLLSPEERRPTPPEWVHTTGVYIPSITSPPTPRDGQATLVQGRRALENDDLAQALSCYLHLIRSDLRLSEVIQDLNQACERFPEDLTLIQTLGDAHLRLGHLQQALSAYTQAEKLLKGYASPKHDMSHVDT
jgi:hypothetical protein